MKASIPRGIEVLVSKASVDPVFRELLLQRRAAAAQEIGLELQPAEAAMIGAVPARQLEAIIGGTSVPLEHRRAFLGHAAVAMVAAVGAMASALAGEPPPEVMVVDGIRPLPPPEKPNPEPAKPKTVEQRVIALAQKEFKSAPTETENRPLVIAGIVVVPPHSFDSPKVEIARATLLVKDLGATPAGVVKFKQALEKEFGLVLPPADFQKVETVGQVIDLVEKTAKTVEQRVIALVQKQFQTDSQVVALSKGLSAQPPKVPVTRATSLVKDLKATPASLIKFRQAMQQEFDLTIPEADWKRIETVGQAIEQVEAALRQKAAAAQSPPRMTSFAIRLEKPLPPLNSPTNQ